MNDRFRDIGETMYDFADRFLVRCPACGRQAVVFVVAPASCWTVRLSCVHCGHSKELHSQSRTVWRGPYDWYFGLPLWLQAPSCGEILWAWNEKHLDFIARYVEATLRERESDPERVKSQYVNKTLASRLPGWIKAAQNRAEILKTIAKLKATL